MDAMVRSLALILALYGSINCVLAQVDERAEFRDSQLDWTRSDRPVLGRGAIRPLVQEPGAASSETLSNTAQLWAVSLQDKTLYRVMRRWAAQAQYQLVWQVDRDFPIESEVVFEGNFRSAVSQVMAGVSMTDFPLQAFINSNTRVLRVVRYLEEHDASKSR